MAIERLKDQTMSCMYCSECMGRGPTVPFIDGNNFTPEWTCPEIDALKFTGYSARGQQHIARDIFYKNMEIDDDVVKAFYACTNCRLCDNVCDISLHKTVMVMREEIFENAYEYLPEGSKKINRNVDQKHNAFGAPNDKRKRWAQSFNLPYEGDLLYFVGCHTSWRQQSIAEACVKILKKTGTDIAYLGEKEWCCGLPCWAHGNQKVNEAMVLHNVAEIIKSGAKKVIFNCAYCYRTFKVIYPEIVGNLPFETVHIVSLLRNMIKDKIITFEKELNEAATYHDPCILIRGYLGEGNDMDKEPRDIIRAIPGLKFKEMKRNKEWAYCCGGGATVTSSSYPEVRNYIGTNRLHEAKEIAKNLYTICPHCVQNFSKVAREKNISLKIQDITEVVAQGMGIT